MRWDTAEELRTTAANFNLTFSINFDAQIKYLPTSFIIII